MKLVPLEPTAWDAHMAAVVTPRLPEPPVEPAFAYRLTERQADQAVVERERATRYWQSFGGVLGSHDGVEL